MKRRNFSFRRTLSQVLRLPLAGPVFRLYAPRRPKKTSVTAETHPPRVLLVNLMPSLGDTICYMALAEVLADAVPGVEITWLADAAMAGLIQQHPNVDRVITVKTPHPVLRRIPTVKMYYRMYRIVRTLLSREGEGDFDLAIVPRGGVDPALSAQAVWVLRVPRSIGYSHHVEPDDVDHNFGDILLTDVVEEVTTLHEASRGLDLMAKIGLVPDATQRWHSTMPIRGIQGMAAAQNREALLHKAGISTERPFVAISPAAGARRKEWPEEKFLQLCRHILHETKCDVVLTGTPAERGMCNRMAHMLGDGAVSTAGDLSLQELIGVLSHASAFVGNDSGTGHIAGALDIPVISLHVQAKGSDPNHIHAPEHYRPAGSRVVVVQPEKFLAPCHNRCESAESHCIAQIEVDAVWDALSSMLKNK